MKKLLLFLIVIQTIISAKVTNCDKLAGHKLDKYAIAKGIEFKQIEPAKAISACKKELNKNSTNYRAMYQLGRSYEAHKEYAKAIKLYKKACRHNYSISCTAIGLLYYEGSGVSKNPTKSIKYFKKACKRKKDVAGCANAGMLYQYGIGVKQDNTAALLYYLKGCQRGYDYACRLYDALGRKVK